MRRVAIDAERPSADVLSGAAAVIRASGVVAMPTDTLYGLAADPFSPAAIARVFAVKGRSVERAVALVAADLDQVVAQLGALLPIARRLASKYWPGPLTLLMARPPSLSAELTGGSDQVGVRVAVHAVTRELCRVCGHLLTATSANVSGEPASDDPEQVARTLATSGVDLLLDAGRTPGGPPSTIVSVVHDGVRLIRPGAIPWDDVQACAQEG
jgi:L-threonylcarbamoyladenylate synthase